MFTVNAKKTGTTQPASCLNNEAVKALHTELFKLADVNKFDEFETKCKANNAAVLSAALNWVNENDVTVAECVLYFKSEQGFQLLKKYGFNFKIIDTSKRDYVDKFLLEMPDYFDLIYTPDFYSDLYMGSNDAERSNVVKGHLLKAELAYKHPNIGDPNKAIEEIEKLVRDPALLFPHALSALMLAIYKQKKELVTAIWQLLKHEDYRSFWQQVSEPYWIEGQIIHCLLRLGEKYFSMTAHVIKTMFPPKENWQMVDPKDFVGLITAIQKKPHLDRLYLFLYSSACVQFRHDIEEYDEEKTLPIWNQNKVLSFGIEDSESKYQMLLKLQQAFNLKILTIGSGGWTLIHYFASLGLANTLQKAIKKFPEALLMTSITTNRMSAVDIAIANGHKPTASMLWTRGVFASKENQSILTKEFEKIFETLFHDYPAVADFDKFQQIVETWFGKSLTELEQDNSFKEKLAGFVSNAGNTFAHRFARCNQTAGIALLQRSGANFKTANKSGQDPRDMAFMYVASDVINKFHQENLFVLDQSRNPTLRRKEQILNAILNKQSKERINELLSDDINHRDAMIIFMCAVSCKNEEIISLLWDKFSTKISRVTIEDLTFIEHLIRINVMHGEANFKLTAFLIKACLSQNNKLNCNLFLQTMRTLQLFKPTPFLEVFLKSAHCVEFKEQIMAFNAELAYRLWPLHLEALTVKASTLHFCYLYLFEQKIGLPDKKEAEDLIQKIFKTENQKLIAELIRVFKIKNLHVTLILNLLKSNVTNRFNMITDLINTANLTDLEEINANGKTMLDYLASSTEQQQLMLALSCLKQVKKFTDDKKPTKPAANTKQSLLSTRQKLDLFIKNIVATNNDGFILESINVLEELKLDVFALLRLISDMPSDSVVFKKICASFSWSDKQWFNLLNSRFLDETDFHKIIKILQQIFKENPANKTTRPELCQFADCTEFKKLEQCVESLKLTSQKKIQSDKAPTASTTSTSAKRNAKKREKEKEKKITAKGNNSASDSTKANPPALSIVTTEATPTIAVTPTNNLDATPVVVAADAVSAAPNSNEPTQLTSTPAASMPQTFIPLPTMVIPQTLLINPTHILDPDNVLHPLSQSAQTRFQQTLNPYLFFPTPGVGTSFSGEEFFSAVASPGSNSNSVAQQSPKNIKDN